MRTVAVYVTSANRPGTQAAIGRRVALDREKFGRTEREVLRLLFRNQDLGMSRDELADRYLMTKALDQVVGEIEASLSRPAQDTTVE